MLSKNSMAEMIMSQLFLLMITDLNTNLVIVKDGRISPLLRSPQFSKVWPTIRADINDLELKFLSPRRVSKIGQYSCVNCCQLFPKHVVCFNIW